MICSTFVNIEFENISHDGWEKNLVDKQRRCDGFRKSYNNKGLNSEDILLEFWVWNLEIWSGPKMWTFLSSSVSSPSFDLTEPAGEKTSLDAMRVGLVPLGVPSPDLIETSGEK